MKQNRPVIVASATAVIALASHAPAGIECGHTPAGGLSVGPVIMSIGQPIVGSSVALSGAMSTGFLGCLGLDTPPLLGDCSLDGCVDGADLGILLSEWGTCVEFCDCELSGDGAVNGEDLGILLSQWGICLP